MNIAKETKRGFDALIRRDYGEAAAVARKLSAAAPNDPGVLTLVGRLALHAQEADIALAIFGRLAALPNAPSGTWFDLSYALVQLRRDREALEATQRAIDADNRNIHAHLRLGEISLSLNDRAAAARAFRRALALGSTFVRAYRGLSRATDENSRGALIAEIEGVLARPRLCDADRAELHYALAELHRSADPHAFIRNVLAANEGQRRSAPGGGQVDYEEMFNRLEAAFTPSAFRAAKRADATTPVPIFILGMPRSGTTLVEQILGSHPLVAMGGELDYVRGPLASALRGLTGRSFPFGFAELTETRLNSLAGMYARRLGLIGRGAPFVTDKTPGNYHAAGLLRILFPQSRVIHVRRCPMDTCLSILAQPFDDRSPHTYDMRLLAHSYARYERLMTLWRDVFGDDILTVDYEQLVEDPETEGRRMFAHCGLAWSPRYLHFQTRRNAVRTFSACQVREPIHRTSVGRWRLYADQLAPLYDALERKLRRSPISHGS